jgi:hypothetical protein
MCSLSLSLSLSPAAATVIGVHHNQISQGLNRTTTITTKVLQPIPEVENSLSLQFIIQEEKERDLKLPTTTTITTQPHTFFQNTSSTSNCLKIVVHEHSKRQGAFYYICVFLFCCFFEVNKASSATPPTTFKIVNNGVNSAVVAPTTEFSTPNSKSLQPNSGCIL